ncbi:hypothetical protein TrRE_jg2569, partial [Triparma retinervis]|jgi:hypothetical protein
LKRL